MDLFSKIFAKDNSSKAIAKERLKLIIIQDRVNFSPKSLEMIKNDIIKVISDYVEVDPDGIEVKFEKSEEDGTYEPALVANIPIKKVKEMFR